MLTMVLVRRTPARLGVGALICLLLVACGADENEPTPAVPSGDAERGQQAVLDYGCVSCHVIPDVREARGRVGPDLTDLPDRPYIAGTQPNRPEVLIQWLQDPQGMRPGTGMPNLGVTDQDARDIAAFLYSR